MVGGLWVQRAAQECGGHLVPEAECHQTWEEADHQALGTEGLQALEVEGPLLQEGGDHPALGEEDQLAQEEDVRLVQEGGGHPVHVDGLCLLLRGR